MLCVIAKLDDAATGKLMEIQKRLIPVGAKAKPPHGHITVATYIGDDEPRFVQSCRRLLAGVSAFDVEYDKIEVLDETSIIVATPVKSESLVSLHQRIAEIHKDALDRWTKGDDWYPHTTLLFDPQLDLHGICYKMNDSFAPFTARVGKIEFSRINANSYEIIDCMALSSR